MRPFKFTLQALYTLRQRQENQTLETYAASLMQRSLAGERLTASERELASAQAARQKQIQAGCLAAHAAQQASYGEILLTRRNEALAALGAAERKVNATLKEMLAARQQREGVEQLLAKQRRSHKAAMDREEQKFLDELSHRRPESCLSAGFEPKAL